jgi:uncharacterized protein YdeI (YjbR/CyaY-like superfamily)
MKGVALVSINETWSAMRFRPINQVKSAAQCALRGKRWGCQNRSSRRQTIIVTDDLAEAFKTSPATASYYETLAYTHREEYVHWITEAKREETRTARVAKTVD